MEFKTIKLDNGLEIVAELNENAYSLALAAFVRAGARDEIDEIAGCSHFLEHMVFKGTPTRTAEQVNLELDRMGGRANAYTTEESTVFYGVVLPELRENIVDLITDMMRPALRQEDFDMEKEVILEEISMYADQPPFGIDDKSRELYFGRHPLGRSVLGSLDSVRNISLMQMKDYFNRRYSPENIVFAATGNVDFEKLTEDIEKRCALWPHFQADRTLQKPVPSPGFYNFTKESATQEYLFQIYPAPDSNADDRYEAALVANIIGDDIGSRLFWRLVDNGKADSAYLSYNDQTDAGTFTAVLACAPEQIRENFDIMNQTFEEINRNGLQTEELERAKNKILSRIVLGSERPSGRLFSIGTEWLLNKRYTPIRKDIELVRSISLEQVNALLEKYPLNNPLTVATGPLSDF